MPGATPAPAVVIGAGAAGLAAARALKRAGIEPIVLERAQPGESWRHRYDGLRLNTVRPMSSLPGYRMERHYGAWPAAPDYAAYLARYSERQDIDVRCATEATRIDSDPLGWALTTNAGPMFAQRVVVATGHDRIPRLPDWPGKQGFTGELLHAADFRNARRFRGKDVLVVGTGSSGCEIAAHLARGEARRVRLAVRSGPLILSRRYFGVRLTYWSIPGRLAPDRLLQRAGPVLQRLAFGDLTHHGLPAPAPDHGLADQRHSRYVPAVDGELVQALRRGDVEVVAAVRRFDGADVELSDDAKLRPDAVIAATGYHPGLQRLAGHLDVLDENGLPRAVAPDPTPGLFFAGYRFSLAAGLPHFKTQARAIAKIAKSLR